MSRTSSSGPPMIGWPTASCWATFHSSSGPPMIGWPTASCWATFHSSIGPPIGPSAVARRDGHPVHGR